MDPLVIGLLGLGLMLLLMFSGVPVGYSMALVGFGGTVYLSNIVAATSQAAIIPYSLIANYNYCVLPLFILMANICFYTGMGAKMFDIVYKWIGHLPGGLCAAAIGSCAMFGAVSASIIATTMTIGLVAIPEMRRYKYDGALSAACISAAGVLGIMIPPSGVLIIYGIITEQSIGELFIAGIVPGILLTLLFMLLVVVIGLIKPSMAPKGTSSSIKEKFLVFGDSIEILLLIILVLGGLIIGWFTPTEAGGIGAFGAIAFALVRRRLSWQGFKKSVVETVTGAGMIFLLLIGAFIFNTFLALSTIPQELADIVSGFSLPPMITMIIILMVYLMLGCFIDSMPMILLTVPVFYPVIINMGFDPIWFGVIIVIVAGMGMITPPVGMGVYIASGIAKGVPMGKIFNQVWLFLGVEFVFCIILLILPQVVTFLPKIM